VTPLAENSADTRDIPPRRGAVAGWAAFRALRRRPAPIALRRRANHRHGRYAKGCAEQRRQLRLRLQWLRGGMAGEVAPGLPPPEHPGWRYYRERRG
jgi:hypothetical protein